MSENTNVSGAVDDEHLRVWIHPDAIRRGGPQASGQYLHFLRSWNGFTLKMSDYRLQRWTSSSTHWRIEESEPDPLYESARKKMKDGGKTFEAWSSLTKEEQKAYRDEPLTHITPEKVQEGFTLEGWARIEGDTGQRRIGCFSARQNPFARREHKNDDHYYCCHFKTAHVSIIPSEEGDKEKHGGIYVRKRDDEFLPPHQRIGEDAIHIHLYMRPDKLRALVMDITAQTSRPELTLTLDSLLFEDEVDRALGEMYHPKEFYLLEDEFAPTILNRITFEMQPLGHPHAPSAAKEEGEPKPPVAPPEPLAPQIITMPAPLVTVEAPQVTVSGPAIPDAVLKGLQHLHGMKIAIWVLAVVVLAVAFIR